MTLEQRFLAGEIFAKLLAREKTNASLWRSLYKRAALPEAVIVRASALRSKWHLFTLSEDWCGDAINSLPVVARLTEAAPLVDMRLVGRDANPDLMDEHLTGASRSIPVIMVLDSNFVERGWWGPRPRPLQSWVMERGLTLSKEQRYREIRTWYARDRGATVLNELLCIMENQEHPGGRSTS